MTLRTRFPRLFPQSIRTRLPLSYAAIALVTAVAVGAVLLVTLRSYYAEIELERMNYGATSIAFLVEKMMEQDTPMNTLQTRLDSFAFFSQARVRLLDSNRKMIIESRTSPGLNLITFNMPLGGDVISAPATRMEFEVLPYPPEYTVEEGSPPYVTWTRAETYQRQTADGVSVAQAQVDPIPSRVTVPVDAAQAGEAGGSQVTIPLDSIAAWAATSVQATVPADPAAVRQGAGNGDVDHTMIAGAAGSDALFGTRLFVDGSPYGVRLLPDTNSIQRYSDQKATATLINRNNQLMGYLELFDGPAIGSEIVDRVAWALLGASAIAIVVAALAGWSISRLITTPLLGLTQITDQMAQGDLSVRAKITSTDEFGSLAKAFNHMTHQVENTIVTLKCFLADAAHELHTPLTALNTNLELAATETNNDARQSFIERALEQLKRLETLTNNLLILSRIETHSLPEERAAVNLDALVRETSEMYASQAEQMGITFSIDVPSRPIWVTANEAQLRRSLCNLLDNAIKFTEENGCVELGLKRDGEGIHLWVQDTGIGIPSEDMPYLFNRFHRGRNTAAYPGNGLGLAIIKAIVESHNGKVAVDNLMPGTRFTLLLPTT